SGSYLEDNNELPNVDLTYSAMSLSPVAPSLFNANGNLNWQPVSGFPTFIINPMSYLYTKFRTKTNNLIGSGVLSYQIIKGLEIKSSFGYNRIQSNSINYASSEGSPPEYRQYYVPTTKFGNNLISSWTIEPQLSYKRNLAKGNLEILIGS